METVNITLDGVPIQAEKLGLPGDKIFGTQFSFRIPGREEGGAFVCGEEIALIRSIEWNWGKLRQPFSAIKGRWGKPTNINNVETYVNIPMIIQMSGDWFSSMGTEERFYNYNEVVQYLDEGCATKKAFGIFRGDLSSEEGN